MKVKPAANFPLDVYFLMDFSQSMKNNLDTLQRLAYGTGVWCVCVRVCVHACACVCILASTCFVSVCSTVVPFSYHSSVSVIRDISSNSRVGFGSFVDKRTFPMMGATFHE